MPAVVKAAGKILKQGVNYEKIVKIFIAFACGFGRGKRRWLRQ